MSDSVAITGNTYPVKDAIKALGGRWDAQRKIWMVPVRRAAEARALVSGGQISAAKPTAYHPAVCVVCGHREQPAAGGYPDPDRILRSGECVSCYEERKQGY